MDSGDDAPHQSSELVASNDDLMTEILLRVPARALLGFKSVSKHWLTLIDDPKFRHNHCRRQSNSFTGLFLCGWIDPLLVNPGYVSVSLSAKNIKSPLATLTFVDNSEGIEIRQSCNGLLLCRTPKYIGENSTYYVYNPATKQYITLPEHGEGDVVTMSLAFDPSKSPHYKVVCFGFFGTSFERYQIEIYSSETRSWRSSGEPSTGLDFLGLDPGMFWNGSLHWFPGFPNILCFDVEQERFRTTIMPPIPEDHKEMHRYKYFGESQGHLYLIELYRTPVIHFRIFEMERDYSKWLVKYRVDLDPMASNSLDLFDLFGDDYSVLCVLPGEKEKDLLLVLYMENRPVLFNPNDYTFKVIGDEFLKRCQPWRPFLYIESLASV